MVRGLILSMMMVILLRTYSYGQYKNTADAAVDAVRVILRQCAEAKTVKRVIHTASISTASPLKEVSGAGYKDFISESCWTSLDVDYPLRSAHFDVSTLQAPNSITSVVVTNKRPLLVTSENMSKFQMFSLRFLQPSRV
jgi:hypothetical protein